MIWEIFLLLFSQGSCSWHVQKALSQTTILNKRFILPGLYNAAYNRRRMSRYQQGLEQPTKNFPISVPYNIPGASSFFLNQQADNDQCNTCTAEDNNAQDDKGVRANSMSTSGLLTSSHLSRSIYHFLHRHQMAGPTGQTMSILVCYLAVN